MSAKEMIDAVVGGEDPSSIVLEEIPLTFAGAMDVKIKQAVGEVLHWIKEEGFDLQAALKRYYKKSNFGPKTKQDLERRVRLELGKK